MSETERLRTGPNVANRSFAPIGPKWRYQDSRRGKSWLLTIKEQRRKFADCLDENPSLKSRLDDCLVKVYSYAKISAAKETGISENVFPDTCPWTFEQIMDTEFYPD